VKSVTLSPASPYRLAADPAIRVVISNLGLACCSMEVDAAIARGLLIGDDGPPTVLLVSGTVTDALAPAVVAAWDVLAREVVAGEVVVVSFGACASTGGPYWDAPTVTKGVDQLIPVAGYVPGCPPRPEALVAALLDVLGDRP
jgi:NADH-quinone oxidoreductase subunit B